MLHMFFNIQKHLKSVTTTVKIQHKLKNARKENSGGYPDVPPLHSCTACSRMVTLHTKFPQDLASFCVKKDLLALVLNND